jgi:hypothetical protein
VFETVRGKKKKKVQERLVGLRLSMEDQMAEFVKVQNNMQKIEALFLKLKKKLQDY